MGSFSFTVGLPPEEEEEEESGKWTESFIVWPEGEVNKGVNSSVWASF